MTSQPKPARAIGDKGRYASAVVSQAIVSIFHFVLNLGLVRSLVPAEYGVFALVFAASLIVASMSNALFTVPLSVLRPARDEVGQLALDRDLNSPTLAFTAIVTVAGVLVGILLSSAGTGTSVAAAAFIGSYVQRSHFRGAGYARFEVGRVFVADLVYVLTAATILGVSVTVIEDLESAGIVLAVLAVANAISAATLTTRGSVAIRSPQQLLAGYVPFWIHSRWALLGALTTMVATQGHGIVIGVIENAETFAPVAAGYVLFGPIRVLIATIQNVLRPEMSRALASGAQDSARQFVTRSSLSMMLAVVALSVLVIMSWGQISARLYDNQYAEAPMGRIVAFWAVVSFVAAAGAGPNAFLQAVLRFRDLSVIGLAGAALTVVLVAVLVSSTAVEWTILGVGVAEAVMLIGTMWLVRDTLRTGEQWMPSPGRRRASDRET